jgi:hypothetical protein
VRKEGLEWRGAFSRERVKSGREVAGAVEGGGEEDFGGCGVAEVFWGGDWSLFGGKGCF